MSVDTAPGSLPSPAAAGDSLTEPVAPVVLRESIGRARAAAAIAVAAWALAVVAVSLMVLGRPAIDENLWFFVVDVTVACVYGTVAAVTLSRRAHPVPWLLGIVAVGGGLAAFGYAYDVWASLPGGLGHNDTIALLQNTAWVPGTLALFLVVPWLVRDHRLGVEWLGLLAGVALTATITVVEVRGSSELESLYWCSIALGLVTAAVVELRRRRGPAQERNGLGWLAVGTAILAVSFVPVLTQWSWLPYWMTPIFHLVSQTVFPAAVLVAVLRNRMWGPAHGRQPGRARRPDDHGTAVLLPGRDAAARRGAARRRGAAAAGGRRGRGRRAAGPARGVAPRAPAGVRRGLRPGPRRTPTGLAAGR